MEKQSPNDILDFWFKNTDKHFNWGDEFDNEIREKFTDIYTKASKWELVDWEESPDWILALIIILDQFPRNIFRNTKKAYDTDQKARELTKIAIKKWFDKKILENKRSFIYMPLMHSEILSDQDLSIKVFWEDNTWAKRHRDIIVKFWRFPYMNEALWRYMTTQEDEYMKMWWGF